MNIVFGYVPVYPYSYFSKWIFIFGFEFHIKKFCSPSKLWNVFWDFWNILEHSPKNFSIIHPGWVMIF